MSFLENKRKMKQRKPPTLRPNNHIPNSPLQSPYQFDVRPSPQAMLPQLMPPTPHLQAYCLPPVQPFMQAGMNYAAPNPVTPTSTVIVTQASVPQTLPITLPAAEVSAAHLPSPDGAATTGQFQVHYCLMHAMTILVTFLMRVQRMQITFLSPIS